VAADIGKVKLDEALAAGLEKSFPVPLLPGAAAGDGGQEGRADRGPGPRALRRGDLRLHLPDPNPEVRKQWASSMLIKLLTRRVRRPDGHDVAGADRRHAARWAYDAPLEQGPARESDETDVPGALPACCR